MVRWHGILLVCVVASAAAGQSDNGAEVRIVGDRVVAATGIRLSSSSPWSTELPLVFDRPYLVRKANGVEYRLWLHEQNAAPQLAPVGAGLRGAGRYVLTQVAGQTFRADRTAVPNLLREAGIDEDVPELVLEPDGTYRMGSAHGRWHQSAGKVWLEGSLANWGEGRPSVDGKSVTFLLRGNAHAFIVLTRQVAG
jgi:hypothetical protein